MYLPAFYKTKFQKYAFNTKRVLPFGIPMLIWITWSFWPQFYNTIYSDIIPPAKGVKRRIVQE